MKCNQLVLTVGYDIENLSDPDRAAAYSGEITTDYYGRQVPKPAHGSMNLSGYTSSSSEIISAAASLFDQIVDRSLLVRRMYLVTNHVVDENKVQQESSAPVQLDLFTDYDAMQKEKEVKEEKLAKERRIQETLLDIKKRFGKNAILKGLNFEDGATAKDRNQQIGGHKA